MPILISEHIDRFGTFNQTGICKHVEDAFSFVVTLKKTGVPHLHKLSTVSYTCFF